MSRGKQGIAYSGAMAKKKLLLLSSLSSPIFTNKFDDFHCAFSLRIITILENFCLNPLQNESQ